MESVHDTFKKLRGLSEDDKNENALLRSRIDEQSQLIMFLKQRLDEAAISTKTIEKLNKELENKRDELRVELQLSTSRFNTLDARFNDLARNHEELIKFKDEYKRQNDVLNKENERLRSENKRLFSDALEKSKLRIQELEEQLSGTLERISLVGKEKSLLESKTSELEATLIKNEADYNNQLANLSTKLVANDKEISALTKRALDAESSHKMLGVESDEKVKQLVREKDEMLALAMQRGKLIQEKQAEIKKLQDSIKEMENSMKAAEKKLKQEIEAASVNAQVKQLREELAASEERFRDTLQAFEGFKKHTSMQIKREQELSAKLRQLVG